MSLFPFSRFTVYGNSMFPTLKPGQDVLVWCWFFSLKKGDLVAFKKSGNDMIKRIQKIRRNEYFLVGDNKKQSTDSRNFGWIKKSQIIGKVIWF